MNELALFAGAGGGILGSHLLGWKTVCAVEYDDNARKVLLARQRDGVIPRFPIWDDVQTFDGKPWKGRVDIVTGGFPCQDISTAGKGKGIYGERSGLWSHMARIISEIRPRYALLENSPAITSRGLGRVLGDLAEMGYDAKWGVLGACHAGANHRRNRWWLVAYSIEVRRDWMETIKQKESETINNKRNKWWSSIPLDLHSFMERIDYNASGRPSRLDDGLAIGMERLARTGNGQVPAVVKLAWEMLKP